MAYRAQTSPVIRFTNLGFVVLLHVAIIWALVQMLARTQIPHLLQSIKTTIIEQTEVAKEEPPPPPPALEKPPPVYVPPIEIKIETSSSAGAIQAVTSNRVWPKRRASNPEPEYPAASKRLREEGSVLLAVLVDATGHVKDGKIEKSSGHPLLDEAALSTVMTSWRFTPGQLEGQPAEMWMKLNIGFRCVDPKTKQDGCR